MEPGEVTALLRRVNELAVQNQDWGTPRIIAAVEGELNCRIDAELSKEVRRAIYESRKDAHEAGEVRADSRGKVLTGFAICAGCLIGLGGIVPVGYGMFSEGYRPGARLAVLGLLGVGFFFWGLFAGVKMVLAGLRR